MYLTHVNLLHSYRKIGSFWATGMSSGSMTMSSQSPPSLHTLNNIILKENLNKTIFIFRRYRKDVSAALSLTIMWLKNALETIQPESNQSKHLLIKKSKSVQPTQRKKHKYCLHQINTMGLLFLSDAAYSGSLFGALC